ncbi:MAG: hypothetical protein NLN65_06720, partial [Candidatus Poseidoniaceae archaeon]|nr:hypothetical protein [Candidatus Poseidoniaceae archaeon]
MSAGSVSALEEVSQAFSDLGSPVEPLLTPDGALRELLHTTSVYAQDRLDVKPYDKELVSWPPKGSSPCDLVKGLPEADRTMLADWNTRMLNTHVESCSPNSTADNMPSTQKTKKAYCDPALFRSASVYADFLRRLDAAGMIHWTRAEGRKGVLGVFFVAKKNGSLRLIFDTRVLNQDFIEPAHTALPSGSAFSNIDMPEDKNFVFGSFDIQNAFYVLGIPLDLAERFSLPAISNRHVGLSHVHNTPISSSEVLLPCLKVLPMGWNWSLYFCQSFATNVVARHVPVQNMILDQRPGVRLSDSTDTAIAVYVDNVGVGGTDQATVNSMLSKLNNEFSQLGIQTHEFCQASDSAEFIGLQFSKSVISVKRKRLWKIKLAIECILSRGKCSGKMLEVIIGHCTWAMLIRRESLSILDKCFGFIRNNYTSHVTIPRLVRQELFHIRSLLPLFRFNMRIPWCTTIHASDASSFGLGVCVRHCTSEQVRYVGRVSERWRFKIEESIGARRSVLRQDPDRVQFSESRLVDTVQGLGLHRFDEVPYDLCDSKHWKVVHGSFFSRQEHITKSEGRALDLSIRHALRNTVNMHKRHVFLVDNMSLCLAMIRGRSSSPALIDITRRGGALALVSGGRFIYRWIPSEWNPSDGPSRGVRPDGSSWKQGSVQQ